MAVRHGYGKIAGTDALVFAYDTGDTRNSYRGEPTVNLVTNGNFSNGITGWSYNGNAASYSEVTTFEGRTVFKSNGLTTYSDRGYIYQTISGLTSGATYTISFDYYIISGQLTYDPDNASNNNATFTSPTGVWKTHTDTFTAASTAVTLNFWGINGNPGYFYITNIQCELKSHKTQFVNGTRSSTQGLLDLTGNSSIDLSNVSFDSNAQMTFDGTNDYVDLSSATSLLNLGSTFSIEGVFKLDNTSQEFGTVFSSLDVATGTQTKGVGFYWKKTAEYGMSANTIRLQLGLSAWSWHIFASNGISISDTNYHHVAVTLTGGSTDYPTIVFYIDGVAQAATKWTAGSIGPINNSSNANSLRLGSIYTASNSSYNNFYSAESLNVVKIYNRVLTAAEVRNNYNNYKSRFNI